MKEIWIDFFRGKRIPGEKHVSVSRVLNSFRSGKFRNEIEEARKYYAEGDMESYNLLKGRLIAITFSGTFAPTRSAENIRSYSGLIVIDIDKCGENLQGHLSILYEDKYVFAVWISPSGDGIKFLIQTSLGVEAHKEVYAAAVEYYTETYAIPVDTTGSDVPRLCYVSYDPDIHVNSEAVLFDDRKQVSLNSKATQKKSGYEMNPTIHTDKLNQKNDLSKKELLKKIHHYLKKRGLSITDTYEKWVRLAFAISNTFNYDFGYKWYLELCKLDGGYFDENESVRLINRSYESAISSSTFGTILYLAEQAGYVPTFGKVPRKL